MESSSNQKGEYKELLDWLIKNKDTSHRIHKSGINRYKNLDKWWFVLKKGKESYLEFRDRLIKYSQLGFQIPDLDEDKDYQLISEPRMYFELFTCRNCHNTLDLSNDLERAWTMKHFHNAVFIPQTEEI